MALTMAGVRKAKEVNNNLRDTQPLWDLKDIITFMKEDPNFSVFASETQLSSDQLEKWEKLITLMSDELYQSLANLTFATGNYLDKQERLNSSPEYYTLN